MMQWKKLLSAKRLGKDITDSILPGRSPFEVDHDRIIFSSAFRRMQDKTQVFPLAESDYVRTRLTHSLEVSCIGRSLGSRIGQFICEKENISPILPSDIGAIVAAASLAHDIGNPPFGHSGEDSIRHWFQHSKQAYPKIKSRLKELSKAEKADIKHYEGNAQGFRILTRLQMGANRGGMQLTSAVLGAFTKYPIESSLRKTTDDISRKKFGFFQSEKELFKEVAEETGLLKNDSIGYGWCRHPLAYVVEAADDITYRIIDYEDGYRLGLVSFDNISEMFKAIIGDKTSLKNLAIIPDDKNKVEYLRSKAFGVLIDEITECFIAHEEQLLKGMLEKELIQLIPSKDQLNNIIDYSITNIYKERRVVEIEAAGYEVASGLLDLFFTCAEDVASKKEKASSHSKKLLELVPKQFREGEGWDTNVYVRLMGILDFFSGMTDSYAVSLFKKVRGISLPN